MNDSMFTNTPLPDILEMKDVSVWYENPNTPILNKCSFIIENKPNQGQFVVILGPSGCGKSTILRLIAGLQTQQSGEILYCGNPKRNFNVGMVFQKYSSFPWMTVRQNLELGAMLGPGPDNSAVATMLEITGLEEHQYKYAQYPLLSGGQLQRVAIARSLLNRSKTLLMDEPFGALDINTRLAMQDLIFDLWFKLSMQHSDTTIVFVTHDISEAVYLADEIWVMQANPGLIKQRIMVPFPVDCRDRDLRRSPEFQKLVNDIEDMY